MHVPVRIARLALVALVPLVPLVTGLAHPSATTAAQEVDAARLRAASSWPELVARDAQLSFTSRNAREAREHLVPTDRRPSPLVDADQIAAAYFALGSGGDVRDRPLLVAGAGTGPTAARVGAVLGLGELRPSPTDFLIELGLDPDPAIAGAACVALARSGDARAEDQLTSWRAAEDVRGRASAAALAFAGGAAPGSPGPEIDSFLALRWASAKAYGFVAGMRWRVHLEVELGRDETFLDLVLLKASAELRAGPRRDHLLEIVLAGGSPERLRGAVAGCADALVALMDAGFWQPSGDAEWNAILDELASGALKPESLELLKKAALEPGLEVRAGLMLVGAGVAEAFPLISQELFAPEAARRQAAAEALGGLTDPAREPDLGRLRRDRDARVRAAALVAQVRRRDKAAVTTLVDLLQGGASRPREFAIEMLARSAADSISASYLEEALLLEDLATSERVLAQVALAARGRSQPRGALRELLATPGLGAGQKELIVRALSASPGRDDLAAMRAMYPVEDSRALNVALARGLIASRDPGAVGLLRQGIWRGPWNRSVLAAGLLARHGGIQALHDELASPPARATEADLRRVGFALGEWGGLSEVDVLARRRRASDPALQGAFLGALVTRTQ